MRKSKKEFIGMLEDGLYVNPQPYYQGLFVLIAAPFYFEIVFLV